MCRVGNWPSEQLSHCPVWWVVLLDDVVGSDLRSQFLHTSRVAGFRLPSGNTNL